METTEDIYEGPYRRRSDAEWQRIAEQSADRAVYKTFQHFGVDLDDARSLREFQRDLAWARTMRGSAERVGGYVIKASVTGLVGGILVAIYVGIKSKLGAG